MEQTIKQFLKETPIELESEYHGRSHMGLDNKYPMDKWECTLRLDDRAISLPFSKGIGHNGTEPNLPELLECIISDINSARYTNGLSDFAKDFGYETGEMSLDVKYSKRDLLFFKENYPEDYAKYENVKNIFEQCKKIDSMFKELLGKERLDKLLDVDFNAEEPEVELSKPVHSAPAMSSGPGF
ncbi:hypothetical protein ACI2KR_08620 [Pseudomonas luteola]